MQQIIHIGGEKNITTVMETLNLAKKTKMTKKGRINNTLNNMRARTGKNKDRRKRRKAEPIC